MASKSSIARFHVPFLFLAALLKFSVADYNITTFGADPTGNVDSTEAIMAAWRAGCVSGTRDRVVVSEGTYLVTGQVWLTGENCETPPYEFFVAGTLVAGTSTEGFNDSNIGWFVLYKLSGFTLSGSTSGEFDGNGETAWIEGGCAHNASSCTSVSIDSVTDVVISNITVVNSKMFHITLHNSENVTVENLIITAPETSPNTDGIHVSTSKDVTIDNVMIATGDDCVSIGDGSKDISMSDITCGPGHGISIGSLGRYEDELPVSGITISDCNITGTMNGLRVKTMMGSSIINSVSNVIFRNITMNNVDNPIIIDQLYCPHMKCDGMSASHVKIDGVKFENIRGTSNTTNAIILDCSDFNPCSNLEFDNIDLAYIGGGPATSFCRNAKELRFNSTLNPTIACDD